MVAKRGIPGTGPKLSEEAHARLIALRIEGHSLTKIARTLHISRQAVCYRLKEDARIAESACTDPGKPRFRRAPPCFQVDESFIHSARIAGAL